MGKHQELFFNQLSKIEALARRLLDHEWGTPLDLWGIQVDIVRHLLSNQDEIAKEESLRQQIKDKISGTKERQRGDWKKELQELQQSLKDAEIRVSIFKDSGIILRQFGDALAWLLLGERKVTSLLLNDTNPGLPRGIGLMSMLRVAENFYLADAGVPIIHDITNRLRVGDITFINPEDEELLTIEVKSRIVSRDQYGVNVNIVTYAVTGQQRLKSVTDELRRRAASNTSSHSKKRSATIVSNPNKKLSRQLERMSRAIKFQMAQHGEPVEGLIDGIPPFLLVDLHTNNDESHREAVSALAIEAKEKGHAVRKVDDGLVYAAGYVTDLFSYSSPKDLPFMKTVTKDVLGKLPELASIGKHQILMSTISRHLTGDVPLNVRPLFAFSLPADLLMDIMWGRLTVMVFVDLGRLVQALNGIGVDARLAINDEEFRRFLIPASKRKVFGKRWVDLQLGDMRYFANKLFYEFQSLKGFTSAVCQTVETATEAARNNLWGSQ